MLHWHRLVAFMIAAVTAPAVAGDIEQPSHMPQPATYCVYDIGRLAELPPGETFVTINAINLRQQIVGSMSVSGGIGTLPFIWDRAHGIRSLGVLPGHTGANATDINDAGKVVGDSTEFESGEDLSFIWDKRNGMRALDASLGGGQHSATGINRFRQVVGGSITVTGAAHAFLLQRNGEVLDLGAFPDGSGESGATAINDRGQVVGLRTNAQITEGFIWDERNGMRPLVDDAGTLVVFPNDINNRSEVVGGTFGETTRAFRWTRAEGLQDLGSLGGSATDAAEANEVNSWGTIVGNSQVVGGASHAFIWRRSTGMRDLNDLLDPTSPLASHIELRSGRAINDFGSIAAQGVDLRDSASPERGLLLTPRWHWDHRDCR